METRLQPEDFAEFTPDEFACLQTLSQDFAIKRALGSGYGEILHQIVELGGPVRNAINLVQAFLVERGWGRWSSEGELSPDFSARRNADLVGDAGIFSVEDVSKVSALDHGCTFVFNRDLVLEDVKSRNQG